MPADVLLARPPPRPERPTAGEEGAPVATLSLDDWQLADQTWRDWRTAIISGYDGPTRELVERAWAAGRLDSAAVTNAPGGNGHGLAQRTAVELIEANGDQGRVNLMRLQQAVAGAGTISGPYPFSAGGYCYVWRAATKDDLEKVWRATGPFLGLAKFVEFRKAMSLTPTSANGHSKKNGAEGQARQRGKAHRRSG